MALWPLIVRTYRIPQIHSNSLFYEVITNVFRIPGKAKALLQAGGLYLSNTRLTSLDRSLQIGDFMDGRVVVLRAGKEHLILELL
jgi:tyrosyl-tRNA synthetase